MANQSPEEAATISFYDRNARAFSNPYPLAARTWGSLEAYQAYEEFWACEITSFLGRVTGDTVLALGCGTARDSKLFNRLGARYVGIDFSEGMLSESRAMTQAPALARMNMRQLGFMDDSFDATWAFDSVTHVNKHHLPQVLAEVRRVLRPTGLAYILIAEHAVVHNNAAYFIEDWSERDFTAAIGEAGLKIEDLSRKAADLYLSYILSPNKD